MDKQSAINDLIRRIYKTAMDPNEWHDLAPMLADNFKTSIVARLEQNLVTGEGQTNLSVGLDKQAIDSYKTYYGPRSVLFRDSIRQRKSGSIFTDEMALDYDEYINSETYNDYLKKYHAEHAVCMVTERSDEVLSYLLFRRTEKIGFYTKDEIALSNLLIPHLVQATQIAREIGRKDVLSQAFGQSFNKLLAGVIILNKSNKVVFFNQAAERIFSRNDGLSMVGEKLQANDSSLQNSIKTLFELVDGNLHAVAKPLLISRDEMAEPYRVSLMPLVQDTLAVHESSQLVLAIVNDPERHELNDEQMLAAMYQLTISEARVVQALCNGLAITEIALVVKSSENAVRFHLKNVFQKLHVKRQSELVSLILKGPLSLLI